MASRIGRSSSHARGPGLVRRFITLLLVPGFLLVAMITPSSAHDRGGPPEDGTGDYTTSGNVDGLPPAIAEATMTDILQEAVFGPNCPSIDGPCSAPPRTCTTSARDDRSNGPIPADAQQIQNIYFVPQGVDAHAFDRPVACSDGSRWESNIGYSAYNGRIFTRNTTNQSNRMNGRAFKHLFRTVSAYAQSYAFYDVLFVRGQQDAAFYETSTFSRITTELFNRGWTRTNVKYTIYSNVTAASGEGGGRAQYNGSKGAAWLRYPNQAGTTVGARWGCGDQGDVAPMQESLHTFGAVQTAAPEHDWGHTYHTTQDADVMFWAPGTTFSGRWSTGVPVAVTQWDPGADSYTNRILTGFSGYLGTINSGFQIHTNCG